MSNAYIKAKVEALMRQLPHTKSTGDVKDFHEQLTLAMRELACDQRDACAEALASVQLTTLRGDNRFARDVIGDARQAVMRARISPEVVK